MIQDMKYIQIAQNIFQERLDYMQQSNPPVLIKKYIESKNFQKILDYLLSFKNRDLETQKFAANFYIQASKCVETYGKNEKGKDRFYFSKNFKQFDIDIAIQDSMLALFYFQKGENITFEPFILNTILEKAIKCIKKNIEIVKLILQMDITEDQLDKFLNDQEVIVFRNGEQGLDQIIAGLSSIDGKRVYLSKEFVQQYYKIKQYKEEEDDLNSSIDSDHFFYNYFKRIQWTIEHHMMENITKYFSEAPDLKSISPERNSNLRIHGKYMVGSGRFFEKKAHNRKFNQPFPLILNVYKSSPRGFY